MCSSTVNCIKDTSVKFNLIIKKKTKSIKLCCFNFVILLFIGIDVVDKVVNTFMSACMCVRVFGKVKKSYNFN